MYLKKVLFSIAVIDVIVLVASEDVSSKSFQCLSTLGQSDCSAKGEFLEIETKDSCCPRCRKGLGK